ncbi:MAG: anthranilate synthase component I, partial [Nitrospirae bacterium]
GYIGYDIVRFFEDIKEKHNKEELGLPDLFLMLFKDILIFDNLAQKIKVVSNAFIDDREPKEAYKEAIERIDTIVEKMKSNKLQLPEHRPCEGGVFSSNFTKDEFMRAVRKIKDYIRAGDVIQTVISQRFKKDTEVHPIHVYRALRLINPSPYMFYLEAGDTTLVGSSPEILVRLEDGRITLRPIAGTRRRGDTEEEDLMLEEELLSDPKENAEHIMLVDLGRNDVGRIAVVGSVAVKEFMQIERYSHVMHIISSVEGVLKEDRDVFDLLRASFPAGTVTGAPKIRAMQIIEELEPVRRGPYAGCVGYISFSGNMDTCITIRTIIFKDGKAYVQAGAGVVADSNPEKEYIETVNKAMALVKAIEMAERGVDR